MPYLQISTVSLTVSASAVSSVVSELPKLKKLAIEEKEEPHFFALFLQFAGLQLFVCASSPEKLNSKTNRNKQDFKQIFI